MSRGFPCILQISPKTWWGSGQFPTGNSAFPLGAISRWSLCFCQLNLLFGIQFGNKIFIYQVLCITDTQIDTCLCVCIPVKLFFTPIKILRILTWREQIHWFLINVKPCSVTMFWFLLDLNIERCWWESCMPNSNLPKKVWTFINYLFCFVSHGLNHSWTEKDLSTR